MMIEFLVTCS